MELLINLNTGNYGEIVFCQNDESDWGRLDCLEKFLVVRVLDVIKSDIMHRDSFGNKVLKFDIVSAFTDNELNYIRTVDWFIPTKSSNYIVEA